MHGLWVVGEEVRDSPALLDVALGIGLQGMDHVWEAHPIPHEEDRKVVSHQIPIALPARTKSLETGKHALVVHRCCERIIAVML